MRPDQTITIDLSWSEAQIAERLDALERLNARAESCAHRWTIPLVNGIYCADCQVVLSDGAEG